MAGQERAPVLTNRKAWHEYTIEDTYEAGIVLVGTEVKSLRAGRANLQEAYCKIENGEIWIHGMHISPYEFGNRYNVDPLRQRKLLLKREEIDRLTGKVQQRGLTLIPLKLYFERGYAKVQLGLGRGKKLYDKRRTIAERDAELERRRAEAGRARETRGIE